MNARRRQVGKRPLMTHGSCFSRLGTDHVLVILIHYRLPHADASFVGVGKCTACLGTEDSRDMWLA